MSERHLSWENVRAWIERGDAGRHAIAGEPRMELFVEAAGEQLGLSMPLDEAVEAPVLPYEHVHCGMRRREGQRRLEVWTDSPELHRPFHSFLLTVADEVQLAGQPMAAAIASAARRFSNLLASRSLLPSEKVLGLLGELWVLERLLQADGSSALSCWTGPEGEDHDFRRGSTELEVKSTTRQRREHVINGVKQLEPSPGRELHVLSLQFAAASSGEGSSLPEAIERALTLLESDPDARTRFEDTLEQKFGYRDSDAPLYPDRFQLRSEPALVHVDEDCPRILPNRFADAVTPGLSSRVRLLSHEIDLEGLGIGPDHPEFQSVLPVSGATR